MLRHLRLSCRLTVFSERETDSERKSERESKSRESKSRESKSRVSKPRESRERENQHRERPPETNCLAA